MAANQPHRLNGHYTPEEAAARLAAPPVRHGAVVDAPGIGDVIAGAAAAVGIKPGAGCGCKGRQQVLNAATPNWVRRLLARVGIRATVAE